MEIIDLTRSLSPDMDTYSSLAPLQQVYKRWIHGEELCNISRITMNTHIGTHVDAPYHFVEGGRTIDQIKPEELIGKADLVDCQSITAVTPEFLESKGITHAIVLFRFGAKRHDRKELFFTLEAIDWLHAHGVHVIGSDNVSIDSHTSDNVTHKKAFGYDMLVVTSLVIDSLREGTYNFLCLPINRNKAEAAPCRAVILA